MTSKQCTRSNKNKKKFHRDDFETQFCVRYLEYNELGDKKLKKWDIKKDKEYTINPGLNEKLEKRYGQQIVDRYCAKIYIKWINRQVEYGAYADQDIMRGDMVTEYTGIIEREVMGNDNLYLWDYPTIIKEKQKNGKNKNIKFCVNAEKVGNFARFINHSMRKYQNVGIQIIPSNGLWHVVYIARRDIKKGEQLLTYYGMEYWKDRKIVPALLTPDM